MPLVSSVSYNPTLKTVTVAGDIAAVSLTSIINQTTGRNLFVVGRTPITNRVFNDGNTTFTLNTNTAGDSASDVLVVRYQSPSIITSIPNGAIVNGVAHFVQPEVNGTGPTTRPGNAPLVIDDKWYNTTKNVDCFWNGTYWLSPQYVITTGRYGTYSATTSGSSAIFRAEPFLPKGNIFFASGVITQSGLGFNNLTNYWTGRLGFHAHPTSTPTLLGSAINLSIAPTTISAVSTTDFVINTPLTGSSSARMLAIELTKFGSAASIFVAAEYYYHFIY